MADKALYIDFANTEKGTRVGWRHGFKGEWNCVEFHTILNHAEQTRMDTLLRKALESNAKN